MESRSEPHGEITRALDAIRSGEPAAFDGFCRLVYAQLRRLASRHRVRADDVLHQTTDLVHDTFDAFARQRTNGFHDRHHFFAFAAVAMRRAAVSWARATIRHRRQDGVDEVAAAAGPDAADLIALDDALGALHELKPRCARVVELRYFAGLDVPATARELGVSERTVEGDWQLARAWLRARLVGPTID